MTARYQFTTAFWLALDSIRAHKLRSFLTLLGIIIGVASVITVGAAIDGLGVYAEQTTAKTFGSDSFLVAQIASVGQMTRKQYAAKVRRNKPIRPAEVEYLRSVTGDTTIYSPYAQRFEDVAGNGQVYEASSVIGASYTLPEIRDVPVAEGRFFTSTEEQLRRHVAVIGPDIVTALFPTVSPLGKSVRVAGTEFVIIGVMEKQGSSFGRSLDDPVYIPFTVYSAMYGSNNGSAVFGKARAYSGLTMDAALEKTRVALRSHFHNLPGEEDTFDTLTPDSVRSFVDQILGVIAAIVVPVTSISLIVGGIVVMNIMLVSVTERTHEIGVRRSLGAREHDILLQFLTESVLLSTVGGMIGVLAGAVLTFGATAVFGTTMHISLGYVLLSVGVSGGVGIISGLYPARRAARLDPVTALRAD